MKLLVIGGVAAGMSAASKLKRINKDADIVVYEKGRFLSYGACGLPYYVSGENDDYTKMIARTKEQFEEMGMHIFLQHEVVKVVPEKKQVMIKDLVKNKLFIDTYDKLMIATGTVPIVPPFPGVQLKNIHGLKTLEDGIYLKEVADQPNIQDVVIVGGGYIGIEVVEAMLRLGKRVRVIELSDRILRTFDSELTDLAEKELVKHGVELNLGEKVEGFIGSERVEAVQTDKGTYPADLVLLSIGVRPATKFLDGSGVALAENGAVIIDREMRTNIKDVYSAGDCAQVYHKVMEENTFIPLGTNANKCGRLAGANIAGQHNKYVGTLGSAAIKVCDLEMGRTGLSEIDARNLAIDYTTVFVKSADHPGYYPNQTPIWIKLICEKRTRRILGAQAIGNKGAVLRIDIFAVAIHNNMSADELGMTDLVYAPPFAGVWDAVHIACNAVK
ncbi:CoA-disulfide reductase [Robertmurraya andreesenii]|uniref:NADPH-dependent 2,4-dienoyl-CoA reductase/sulfur reductase-like enzyme n=1 Tax=Anoxybacillus andreesenii TaxID=1325932 RepID=A0ABT9V7D6_9BACL|nr:CoA-disulfide reductase [Robertmurraya andreesenii]MDQ0156860.1 NADPH-dependent 2,4-dienoyl-CoA reductase/sulfur reductase-like enzyme [Robertmurraya andreesenii]